MRTERQFIWPESIPEMATERLLLKGLSKQDAVGYFKINSMPEVMVPYGVPCHMKILETENLIHWLDCEFKAERNLRWGIFEKETGNIIGDIGFWRLIPSRASGELGAKLHPAFWRMGIISEAMQAAVSYSFSKLNARTLECYVEKTNQASLKLCKRLGFCEVGIIKGYFYSEEKKDYVDSIFLTLNNDEWQAKENLL